MENWIQKAFEEASEDAEEWAEAEDMANNFINDYGADLLDGYLGILSEDVAKRFSYTLVRDKELLDALLGLCLSFFVTGFFYGLHSDDEDE